MRPSPECRRHRAALTAYAAHREQAASALAALDHAERCRSCRRELEELALTAIAVQRLADAEAPLSASAWPALRARIERSRASAAALAWRWRATVAGLAAGTLVVAAIVAPLAINGPLNAVAAEPVGYSAAELDGLNQRIEQGYLLDARTGTLLFTTPTTDDPTVVPKRYPDGLTPVGKEVPNRSIGRPLSAD
jgi:hypothetical protein